MNRKVLILLGLVLSFTLCAQSSIFQYSLFSYLAGGNYHGNLRIFEFQSHGNTGIGTFNALDGELIMYNGICYRAKSDSINNQQVEIVNTLDSIPFAMATQFKADTQIVMYNTNRTFVDSLFQTTLKDKLMAVIIINGHFKTIKYRSVQKQKEPFIILADAIKSQRFFESKEIDGTLIGFYFPEYMKELNVQGFHWHFLSDDKKHSGHLLDYSASKLNIEFEIILNLNLQLLNNESIINNKNYKPNAKEIEYIEKAR